MFFAGVIISQAVFFFDRERKKKKFYLFLSAVLLQVLNNVEAINVACLHFIKDKTKTIDETEAEKYLKLESQKLSAFMELYVLLLIQSVPKEGRKHINYKSWSEAQALINEIRSFVDNGEGER